MLCYAAALCIEAAGRDEAQRVEKEAAGQYYGKDQADGA